MGLPQLGDVDGVAEDDRGPARALDQPVAIGPEALGAVARAHQHVAGVAPGPPQAREVLGQERAGPLGQEVGEAAAGQLLGQVAERRGGGGVDRVELPLQVVRADQAEAVLEELPVVGVAHCALLRMVVSV